jgi:hypothetical protein
MEVKHLGGPSFCVLRKTVGSFLSFFYVGADACLALSDVIKSFLTDPSKPEIDIEVKNLALEGMQTPPYEARVDLYMYMVYYSAADHSERSLHHGASLEAGPPLRYR